MKLPRNSIFPLDYVRKFKSNLLREVSGHFRAWFLFWYTAETAGCLRACLNCRLFFDSSIFMVTREENWPALTGWLGPVDWQVLVWWGALTRPFLWSGLRDLSGTVKAKSCVVKSCLLCLLSRLSCPSGCICFICGYLRALWKKQHWFISVNRTVNRCFNVQCKWFEWINSDLLCYDLHGNGIPVDWRGADSNLTLSYWCRICPDGFPDGFDVSKYCDPDNETLKHDYVNCPIYKEHAWVGLACLILSPVLLPGILPWITGEFPEVSVPAHVPAERIDQTSFPVPRLVASLWDWPKPVIYGWKSCLQSGRLRHLVSGLPVPYPMVHFPFTIFCTLRL